MGGADRNQGDRPVAVEVEMNGGSRQVIVRAEVTQIRVRTSEQFVTDVERLCGVGSVTIILRLDAPDPRCYA